MVDTTTDTGTDAQAQDQTQTQTVEQVETGTKLSVKITRGTEVRDQEEFRVSASGETAGETLAEFRELLEEVKGDLGSEVRGFQPQAEAADEDETDGD